jgi:hypothetical protein
MFIWCLTKVLSTAAPKQLLLKYNAYAEVTFHCQYLCACAAYETTYIFFSKKA